MVRAEERREVGVAGAVLLPFTIASPLFWPLLLLWGAGAYGAKTVALIELGHRHSGDELLAGIAAFSVMRGIGGILGPTVAGHGMDVFGPEGLWVVLAAIFAALAVTAAAGPLRGGAWTDRSHRSSAHLPRRGETR